MIYQSQIFQWKPMLNIFFPVLGLIFKNAWLYNSGSQIWWVASDILLGRRTINQNFKMCN